MYSKALTWLKFHVVNSVKFKQVSTIFPMMNNHEWRFKVEEEELIGFMIDVEEVSEDQLILSILEE